MTTDIATDRLRLRSPSDIVDAVPYLVGFQPESSMVVLSLRGKRSRVGLTARVDLPSAASAAACAREFVDYLKRDGAERAVIVFYPPSGGPSHSSVQPLTQAMGKQLARAGIEVSDVLCVCDGRWWSVLCTDDECCPTQGTPVSGGGTSVCAATMAVHGRVVLASRADLEHTIDPAAGAVGAAMAYALPRAQAQLIDRIVVGDRADAAAESFELFRTAVRGRLGRGHPAADDRGLGIDEAARLIVALDDVRVRDEILTWFDGDWGDAARELLLDLVRHAVPPYEVPPLTVLAWIAYLQGEGALAGIALDRALTAEPGYGMAKILDQALTGACNPDVFRIPMRGMRTEVPAELCG